MPSAPHRGLRPDKICTLPYFLGSCLGSGDFVLGKSLKNIANAPKTASQTQNAVRSAGGVNIDDAVLEFAVEPLMLVVMAEAALQVIPGCRPV